MDSQPIAVLLLFTSLAINIGLIMLQDPLKPRDEENAIEVQKASSNALTGMVLALLIAQPLAFASAVMGTEVFGWIIGMGSMLLGFGFLLEWRKYKAKYQQLLLQEAIAKGVEIGMKRQKRPKPLFPLS